MRVAICEDIAGDAHRLSALVRESGFETEIDIFESGEDFLRTFRRGQYHMIFLDIYMDGVTGMETAAAIRKQDADAPVAFVTTSREHALEANR